MPTLIIEGHFASQWPEDQNGVYKTFSGKSVILCHASSDGTLEEWAEEALTRHPKPFVVSCFPVQVQRAHPDVVCVGDWETSTDAEVTPLLDEILGIYPGALLLKAVPSADES
jgi:hypothetical protein